MSSSKIIIFVTVAVLFALQAEGRFLGRDIDNTSVQHKKTEHEPNLKPEQIFTNSEQNQFNHTTSTSDPNSQKKKQTMNNTMTNKTDNATQQTLYAMNNNQNYISIDIAHVSNGSCNNKSAEAEYNKCTQQLIKCNHKCNTQNKTIIQLNNTKNAIQNILLLSQQNNTNINHNLTLCHNKYDQLLSNYTTLQTQSSNVEEKLKIKYHEINQKNNELMIKNQQLYEANDRYIYGKLDQQMETLKNHTTHLQTNMKQKDHKIEQQNTEIKQLSKQNGQYMQTHNNDEQKIQSLENNNTLQKNKINKHMKKINELTNENNIYTEKFEHYKEQVKHMDKRNKQLQKNMNVLTNSFSLHTNARLNTQINKLNNTLIQSTMSLRDSELRVGELSHELGECNVEWGSCEQKYVICETATKVLQKDIQAQKQRFMLCNNVTKTCKKERKEVKLGLKNTQKELNNCTNNMNNILMNKCWIIKEYKIYFYLLIGLCVFIIVMGGVIIYMFMNNLYNDTNVLKQEKNELLKRMGNWNELNEKILKLKSENKGLMKETNDLKEQNRIKDEQMQRFASFQIEQQRKQRKQRISEKNISPNEVNDDDKNENATDSNDSWSSVSKPNESVHNEQLSESDNKKSTQ